MGYNVQQNVAGQPLKFLLVDATTHIPGVTGLDTSTFTAWLSKDGGPLVLAAGGSFSEIGRGRYAYWASAADLDTLGTLGLSIDAPGADPADEEFYVTEYDPTITAPAGSMSFIAQMQARGIGAGLSATQWSQVASDALAMYSRYRPRILIGAITTVADQEQYDLPAGGHICLAVAPWNAWADFGDAGLDAAVIEAEGEPYLFAFDLPSLTDLYHMKYEAITRQWGSSFDQMTFGGKVRLIPPPDTVKSLAVLYTALHTTVSTVPDGDWDLLLAAGDACALAALALGTAVTVIGSGGRLTLGPYTQDMGGVASLTAKLFDQAKAAEQRFMDRAQSFAPALKG
jgi:hypothetical protein